MLITHTRAKKESPVPDHQPSPIMWLWIAIEWWFLGLVAYHLILEHRAHLQGALPYVLLVITLPIVYVLVRARRRYAR
jgi:hypothetical protein